MVESGDWRYPTRFGEPYLNKPPLLFWVMGCGFSLGGVNETSARLPAALLAALAVPLLYLAGREAFQRETPAVTAALVYLTLLPAVRHGRLAMTDGLINTLLTGIVLCLLLGMRSRRWLAGVGVGLGLIALTKGVLAIGFGVLLLGFVLTVHRADVFRSRWLLGGIVVGFAPVAAWYGLQIREYGSVFVQTNVIDQSLARTLTVVEGHARPAWYYAAEIAKLSVPWLFFAAAGFIHALRSHRQTWELLVLAAGGGFFLVISLMPTKLPWYVLPCYVFFALAAGWSLGAWWEGRPRAGRALAWGLGVSASAGAIGLWYLRTTAEHQPPTAAAVAWVLTCAAGAVFAWRRSRLLVPALASGLYIALLLLFGTPSWNWEVNEAFDVRPVAKLVRQFVPHDSPVRMSFPYRRPSLDFYAGRPVLLAEDDPGGGAAWPGYLLVGRTDSRPMPSRRELGRAGEFILLAPAGDTGSTRAVASREAPARVTGNGGPP